MPELGLKTWGSHRCTLLLLPSRFRISAKNFSPNNSCRSPSMWLDLESTALMFYFRKHCIGVFNQTTVLVVIPWNLKKHIWVSKLSNFVLKVFLLVGMTRFVSSQGPYRLIMKLGKMKAYKARWPSRSSWPTPPTLWNDLIYFF